MAVNQARMPNTARMTAKLINRIWQSDRAYRRLRRAAKTEKKQALRVNRSEPSWRQFVFFLTLLALTAMCFFVVSYIAGLARVSLLTDR